MKVLDNNQTTKQDYKELNYYFLNEDDLNKSEFSLDLEDSDFGFHETILNSLIGNLVKFNTSGKIEPYLAESFKISSDGKQYTYKLRKNLYCDDGTPITPVTFVNSLTNQLKIYSRSAAPLEFALLDGYLDFKNNKSSKITGLKSDHDSIVFSFLKKPEDLNELLRMPYFGFWCKSNLNNKWKESKKFVSSGPYSLSSDSTDKKITVRKRYDWFSSTNKSIDTINFRYRSINSFSDFSNKESNFIIESNTRHNLTNSPIAKFKKVIAPPTSVATFVLSPTKDGPFKDKERRQALLNKIRLLQKKHDWNSSFFYANAKSDVTENKHLEINILSDLVITVGNYYSSASFQLDIAKQLLESATDAPNVKYSFLGKSAATDQWQEKMVSNKYFDIRYSSVANGAYPRNFIIKMMFCSNLGVRYPDPSNRICALVKAYEDWSGPLPTEYIKNLNQIIYDDACVIPLEHFGPQWILSDNVNTDSFPSTVETPLFEAIEIK